MDIKPAGVVIKRFSIITFLCLTLFSLFYLAFSPRAEAGLADSPWPKFHFDSKNTGQSPYKSYSDGTLKWRYSTGSYVESSPAIAADGTIYIASRDYYLYAINPDGTLKWRYLTGDCVDSSPAIAADGTIYVGSNDKYLYAINPDGTLKWRYLTSLYANSTPAIAADGTIYVGNYDGYPRSSYYCYFYAINPDGTLKWRYQMRDYSYPSSPAIAADGTIFIGSTDHFLGGGDHYLYALNPNGTLKWRYFTGDDIYSSPALAADGIIYVSTLDGHLYALNPDGTLKWQYLTVYIGWDSSPAIATDGTIYVGSGQYLYAIYPDGTLKWQYPTGNTIFSSPAIASDCTIYVGSNDGYLYAINPNGTLKWQYLTSSAVESSPAIGTDGTVYVGSWDGYLYAFSSYAPPTFDKLDPDLRGESMWSDPVDTGTGGHYIKRTLLTVDGAQPVSFEVNYNSLLLNQGPMGMGWSHNYEAHVTERPDGNIDLYWDANRVNAFVYNGNNTYLSTDLPTYYDTITKNTDGTYTLNRKDKTVYEFDTAGRLTQVKNSSGQPVNLAYDAAGRLQTITEPVSGRRLTLHYNSSGLIDYVSDPQLSRQVSFTYKKANLMSITDAAGYITNYTYNRDGRILSATDNKGQIFKNTYYADGRVQTQDDGVTTNQLVAFSYDETSQPGKIVTTVTDRLGHTRTYVHNTAIYNLISVTDECNHTNSYTYNTDGNRSTAVNAINQTTRYDYDSRGNLTAITDPFGNTTGMTYYPDGSDNLQSTTNAAGETVQYYYEDPSYPHNVTRMVEINPDPLNNNPETRYVYCQDGSGLLWKEISPRQGETVYTYQPGLTGQTVTDPENNTVTYGYDAAGRLLTVTDGAGKTTAYEYYDDDTLKSVTDPLSHKTSYTYDSRGDTLTETDANNHTTNYQYDGNGNLERITDVVDGVNYETVYQYDGKDRLEHESRLKGGAECSAASYEYYDDGKLWKVTDGENHTTEYKYDALGRLTETLDANNKKIATAEYDNNANEKVNVTDALTRKTEYQLDDVYRISGVTDPAQNHTGFTRDAQGRLSKAVDPEALEGNQRFDLDGNIETLAGPYSNQTGYYTDKAGRLRWETPPVCGTVYYEYNNRNLIDSITNGKGDQSSYRYYDDRRLSYFTDLIGTVSYDYQPNGNLWKVTEGSNVTERQYYEGLNLVKSYRDARGNVIQYEYNAAGNLVRLTYPDGKQVTYEYYKDNRLKSVTDWNQRVTAYEYWPNGLLYTTTRPDGSVQTVYYDDAYQLIKLEDKDKNGGLICGYDYTYSVDGSVYKEILAVPLESFTRQEPATTDGPDNRIATYNGQEVLYDKDGNMKYGPLNGAMAAYTWDARDRLTAAGGLSYTYDAEGNRTGVTEGGSQTSFVVDPNAALSQVLIKTDASGNQTFYVYGLGLIGQEENGAYRTYHYDLRGSTVALTDTTGNVTDRFQYSFYGELVYRTGSTSTPFLFNGRDGVMTDANGLLYMRARYYNPEIGRFVSRDPVTGSIVNPKSIDAHSYCENDPVNGVDPSGEIIETVADAASLGYSAYELIKYPSWGNAGYLLWDVGATVVPFAPGSYVVRGSTTVVKVVTREKRVARVAKTANVITKIHKHHIYPREFRSFFRSRGINIDKYTIELDKSVHLRGVHGKGIDGLSGKWNQRWEKWIKEHPRATKKEVERFAQQLLKEYGLDKLPIKPYK
ncbi:MAG: PQQ-binding-like beta-propeller repeat protein [Bacillota bacterium]